MNYIKIAILSFILPVQVFSQCSPDSISILTKSSILVELVKPCPKYMGKKNKDGSTTVEVGKYGSLTFNEIFEKYCPKMIRGEVKVYNMYYELIQYAKVINHQIKTYETYRDNDNLASRMNYLEGDSIYTLVSYFENGNKHFSEFISPDSGSVTFWTTKGLLSYTSKAWNLKSDTTLHNHIQYDEQGKFSFGRYSKGVIKSKSMGREMIESYYVNQKGERIEK